MIRFQQGLVQRLVTWALVSITLGSFFNLLSSRFWHGLSHQFIGWGIVDALISWFARRSIHRQRYNAFPLDDVKTAKFLKILLMINSGLDVLYIIGGVHTITRRGARDNYWRGAGWGITIQGGFLFIFDLAHWFLIRKAE